MQQHIRSQRASGLDGEQAGQSTITNRDTPGISRQGLRLVRNRSFYERRIKRSFDVVIGVFVGVATAPLALFTAGAVRVGLGKPVLYEQQRIGQYGELFTIYKFRTMRPERRQRIVDVGPEQERRNGHKRSDDPRHTNLGRYLRQLSLDELPQMINILRGEMSLVGPRPELQAVAEKRGYANHIRHQVKPGLTGPYQTSDLRRNGDLRDGLHLDTEYVMNVSFRNDLKYLIKTAKVLLTRATGS